MNKKLFYNKTAKGLVSLITIIILMSSILATTIYYNNMITANVVQESSVSNLQTPPIKEISDLNELSQLNEGWYEIRNGYVFYLESFDSYVPLYIKVKNPQSLNGLLVVDEDGNIEFSENKWRLVERKNEKTEETNIITGEVTGLEGVSGMQAAQTVLPSGDIPSGSEISGYILPNGQAKLGPPPSTIKDYTLEYIYNGKTYRNKVANGVIGDNFVFSNVAWVPIKLSAPTPAPASTTSPDITKYTNYIQDTYNKYPQLKNYPGIIEQIMAMESGGRNTLGDGGNSIGPMQIYAPNPSDRYYGYTREELKDPAKNFDAGAQKILEIIRKNPNAYREQIWYGYNQENPPSLDAIRSGDPAKIYPNVDPNTARQLYESRRDAANSVQKVELTSNKVWEVQLNNGNWITISGNFNTRQEVLNKYAGQIKDAREPKGAPVSQYKYYVYDDKGNYVDYVTANNIEEAKIRGQERVSLEGKTYGDVSEPKFKLYHPDTGEQFYSATRQEEAIQKFRETYGKDPQTVTEIKPGEKTRSTNTYVIKIEGAGQEIKFNAENEEEAQRILKNYQENFLYKDQKLSVEKLPTLEDLKNKNPGVRLDILQKELQNLITGTQAKSEELKEPKLEEINLPNGKKVYYVGNERFEKKDDADVALKKANFEFNKALTEKYAKQQLKDKQLTSEITPNGELLAKDSKGVYKFVPTKDSNGKIIGGTFESVGDSYQRLKTIGQGTDAISVIETIETKTGKQTKIEAEKNGNKISIDQDTLNQLEKTGGKNVNIDKDKLVIEFIDPKTGLLVRQTFSEGYTPLSGTKTEETFRLSFFDENGKPLSKQQVEQLQKEGKLPQPQRELKETKESQDGKLQSFTSYSYRTESRDGKNIRVAEGIKINAQTGKREGFIYRETDKEGNSKKIEFNDKGQVIDLIGLDQNGNKFSIANDPELEKFTKNGNKAESQYNSRQFFASVERVFTEFRGLGYYATLFWDDDFLLKWRDDVDRAFAHAHLGIEYWTSDICSNRLHGEQEGVAFAETPQGLAQVGAHIEATRTQKIVNEKGEASYIYKITFNVRNGDYEKDLRAPEEMNVSALIVRDEKLEISKDNDVKIKDKVDLFKKDINVTRGSSYGRRGIGEKGAIVRESKTLYHHICLTFNKIPLKWKLDNKFNNKPILCNKIIESPVESTKIREAASPAGTVGELNDF